MTPSPFQIEAITGEAGLTRLGEDWERLRDASESPNVFASYDWYRAWNARYTRDYASPRTPLALVLRRNSEVAAIAPLVRVNFSRAGITVPRIEFAGHEWDYNDLLVGEDGEEAIAAVALYLAQHSGEWDFIELRKLRDVRGSVARMDGALARVGLPHSIHEEAVRCPYLPLTSNWEEMLAKFSASTRHGLRVRQSRLQRMTAEGLGVRIVTAPHAEPELLERMIALEAQKQVRGAAAAPFVGRYHEVFAELFRTLGPRGVIGVAVMEWNGRMLAWNMFFRCGRKLWGYLTAFDREFARLSPGTMLLPAIIDHGYAEGCDEFDFMSGEDSYKQRWTTAFHATYRVRVQNPRLPARLRAKAYLALRPGAAVGEARQSDGLANSMEFDELSPRTETSDVRIMPMNTQTPRPLAVNYALFHSEEAVNALSFYRLFQVEEELFRKYYSAGQSVLDLACGAGRTTLLLQEAGMKVRGSDFSELLIRTAQRRLPYLDLRVGSYDSIAEPDASYDHVLISFNGIDYAYPLSQRVAALRECFRVLKPGGTFIYSSHNTKSLHLFSPYYHDRLRWKLRNLSKAFLPAAYVLEDGAHAFYTSPGYVLEQTSEIGFEFIEMRGFSRFRSVTLDCYLSPYVYYVFTRPK